MGKIKVGIAEDQNIMRNGLVQLLQDDEGLEITHIAENGQVLLDLIESTKIIPDVTLIDIEMPVLNGFETTRILKSTYPEINVLFLSTHTGKNFIEKAIAKGANGYISKDEEIDKVFEAIHEVYENGVYFNEMISFNLIQDYLSSGKIKPKFIKEELLSAREIEFIRYICQEKTDQEIADLMNLSIHTSLSYRKAIMKKIGVKKSIGIVIYAIKHEIFTI